MKLRHRDVEDTTSDLSESIKSLVEKAVEKGDVKDVKEQVSNLVAEAKEATSHRKDELVDKAREAAAESANAGAQQAHEVATTVQEKKGPLFGVGGALVVGLLLGWLLARRRS
jgi:ElaB/YqjD/DUF883 family membrane-anchored ribosome-binding protein